MLKVKAWAIVNVKTCELLTDAAMFNDFPKYEIFPNEDTAKALIENSTPDYQASSKVVEVFIEIPE